MPVLPLTSVFDELPDPRRETANLIMSNGSERHWSDGLSSSDRTARSDTLCYSDCTSCFRYQDCGTLTRSLSASPSSGSATSPRWLTAFQHRLNSKWCGLGSKFIPQLGAS